MSVINETPKPLHDNKKVDKMIKRKNKLETKLRHLEKKMTKKKIFLPGMHKTAVSTNDEKMASTKKIFKFVQVREKYFQNLQDEICSNLKLCSKELDIAYLQKLSLQFEQKAILACLEPTLYKQAISSIVSKIKLSSEKGIPCTTNVKLEANVTQCYSGQQMENASNSIKKQVDEGAMSDLHFHNNEESVNLSLDDIDAYNKPVSRVKPQYTFHQIDKNVGNANLDHNSASCSFPRNEEALTNKESINPETDDISMSHNLIAEGSFKTNKENNYFDSNRNQSDLELFNENDMMDVIKDGHVYESYECNEEETEEVISNNIVFDNEIQKLMDILEGTEQKQNLGLEHVQNFFGYGSNTRMDVTNSSQETYSEPPKKLGSNLGYSWKSERYIFLYKIFKRCKSMSASRFFRIRKCLGNYFGEDSDFEHEEEFNDSDTFLTSCARRILPTVTKCVLPYYLDHRIRGGSYIFKNLVRRIADSLVDNNDWPTEHEIETYVNTYFPPGKTYNNVSDVWCYEVEYNW